MFRRSPMTAASALLVVLLQALAVAQPRHALLVGCTRYQAEGIRPLPGAANDVARFQQLLTTHFGFTDIVTLVGWPDDSSRRPTYENICQAFEELISKATNGSQVVVLLSGHGCRFPLPDAQTDWLDPRNPEPDGYDEAFLPADYQPVNNMIRDNQVGQWLDQLRARGAHVWIVFDSCFSGTMMKSTSTEVSREVDRRTAGMSEEALEAVRRKAQAISASVAKTADSRRHDGLDAAGPSHSPGSVVAFYAAQDFEPAPELILPLGAEPSDDNRHGLLSYHLVTLLSQATRQRQITYRDLGRLLVGRYRGERGSQRPTPLVEGFGGNDLDREVLGLGAWPEPKLLVLEKTADGVHLSAGQLAGVVEGTLLSVHPPGDREGRHLIGHVRAVSATATAAKVEWDAPKAALLDLPEGAVCRIVERTLGDMRLRLALVPEDTDESRALTGRIAQSLKSDAGDILQFVEEDAAQWLLAAVSPGTPVERFQHPVTRPALLLVSAHTVGDQSQLTGAPKGPSHRVQVQYALDAEKSVEHRILDDLRRVFQWQSLWRIAGAYDRASPIVPSHRVELRATRLRGGSDAADSKSVDTAQLRVGDKLSVEVVSKSYEPYWYTVLFLNGNYGVEHIFSGALPGRAGTQDSVTRKVELIEIDDSALGVEGYVLIAVSQDEHPNQLSFEFLKQAALGSATTKQAAPTRGAGSPFDQLLLNAARGGSAVRSARVSPDNPQMSSVSWITVGKNNPGASSHRP